jgi:hypothetical protein
MQLLGLDRDRFLGPRHARAAVGAEFAHRAGAEEIGDEAEALAIPGEQDRAGAGTAVAFLNLVNLA